MKIKTFLTFSALNFTKTNLVQSKEKKTHVFFKLPCCFINRVVELKKRGNIISIRFLSKRGRSYIALASLIAGRS